MMFVLPFAGLMSAIPAIERGKFPPVPAQARTPTETHYQAMATHYRNLGIDPTPLVRDLKQPAQIPENPGALIHRPVSPDSHRTFLLMEHGVLPEKIQDAGVNKPLPVLEGMKRESYLQSTFDPKKALDDHSQAIRRVVLEAMPENPYITVKDIRDKLPTLPPDFIDPKIRLIRDDYKASRPEIQKTFAIQEILGKMKDKHAERLRAKGTTGEQTNSATPTLHLQPPTDTAGGLQPRHISPYPGMASAPTSSKTSPFLTPHDRSHSQGPVSPSLTLSANNAFAASSAVPSPYSLGGNSPLSQASPANSAVTPSALPPQTTTPRNKAKRSKPQPPKHGVKKSAPNRKPRSNTKERPAFLFITTEANKLQTGEQTFKPNKTERSQMRSHTVSQSWSQRHNQPK